MNNTAPGGPFFIIIAALLWSLDGLLRISLYSLPSSVIVFYEHVLGFCLLLFVIRYWLPDIRRMTKREWAAISIVALCSGALGTILYTQALSLVQYSSYSVVVLLQQLQPIWAIGAARMLLKERISKEFLLWAAVALLSAYFISFKDLTVNIATGSGTIMAAVMALSAGFLWGTSTAVSKYVLTNVSFLTGTALRFLLAPLFALLFIAGQHQIELLARVSWEQWKTLVIITFSTGLVALAVYYYGLKKTPAHISTLCELVWPASAVVIDYFFFEKTLSVTQIVGIGALALAIYHIAKPRALKT